MTWDGTMPQQMTGYDGTGVAGALVVGGTWEDPEPDGADEGASPTSGAEARQEAS